MKKLLGLVNILFVCSLVQGQEEIKPLLSNPYLFKEYEQSRASNKNLDSTFVYIMDTLDLPVWDDFSINKFEQYNADFSDGNVTSQWYYYLMNASNTAPQDPSFIFCDSTQSRHDTISVVSGVPTITTTYFTTAVQVWVNDLNSFPVTGQLKNLYQECYVLIDSVIDGVPDPDQDTIWYTGAPNADPQYVQDSANVFTVNITDPNRIWIDNQACHNYRFAVDPWSLGVATLDGVDSLGMPYDFANSSAYGIADYLTSKHINLWGKTNVYLTFLYQAEGYGNMPDAEDSLIVEFWNADSAAWYPSYWYKNGGTAVTPDIWDTAHIAVPPLFLRDGFRFRFKNYASTSGALDHWHIDYVNLKDNDLPTISNFSDLAVAYPINSLLKDYTSVPWDHYLNANPSSKMLDSVTLYVYNSDVSPTNYADGQFEVRYGGIIQAGTPYVLANPAVGGGWTGNWEMGLNAYKFAVGANYSYNQSVITSPLPQATFDVKVNIDASVGGSNIYDVNDTTYFQQFFSHYYSYDDGSAEAAYGVTGAQAKLAYKFDIYEPDTLMGILMSFVPSVNDMSSAEFLLTIWDDNGGEPGNIIYQDDYFNTHSPVYGGGKNGFHFYKFQDNQTVLVDQVFYVGTQQLEPQSLNLGMDMNIPNSDKIFFVNSSGNWTNSSYSASLLIRPVFSTQLNFTLSDDIVIPQEMEDNFQNISIYPNPANNLFNIRGISNTYYSINVYDMSGRLILQKDNETEIDIVDFESGIYIVDIRNGSGESIFTEKLIKQ